MNSFEGLTFPNEVKFQKSTRISVNTAYQHVPQPTGFRRTIKRTPSIYLNEIHIGDQGCYDSAKVNSVGKYAIVFVCSIMAICTVTQL